MKAKILILSVMAAAMSIGMGTTAVAATNEVSVMLQKGLFEEEANRNLDAAIKAYQTVIAQTEKDRQFAATAVFRLGECYRKQGNTSEANAQYQRILREFPEQTELAKLSRQQLGPLANSPTGGADGKMLAEEIRKMSPEKRRVYVQQKFPNPVMNSLMEKMNSAETELAGLRGDLGPQHPTIVGKESALKSLYQQIDLQVDGVMSELANNKDSAAVTQQLLAKQEGELGDATAEAAKAQEAIDIKNIQVTIRDNPDLINAYQDDMTSLLKAVNNRRPGVVKYLLESGADPELKDQRNGNNFTPLISATRLENKEIVELLVKHGVNVDATDGAQRTALHRAAERGYRTIAEILLSHKADVNARDGNGLSPLRLAAEKGFKSVAELLLSHGADVNSRDKDGYTPLHAAIAAGNKAIVEWLIANKADINAASNDGHTPLASAIIAHRLELAKLLLTQGANTEVPFGSRHTRALHLAVYMNAADYCQLLLENHADATATCNATENQGVSSWDAAKMTPLMMAANGRYGDPAEILLRYPAGINLTNSNGRTALLIAVEQNDPAMVQQLLKHEANANLADVTGTTPLLLAVEKNKTDIAEALIESGAKVNVPWPANATLANVSPLQYAVGRNETNIVKLLLEHSADPNTTVDSVNLNGSISLVSGWTPLITATRAHNLSLVQLLLDHKAEPSHPDRDGQTPLHHAIGDGQKRIAEILIAGGADVNAKDAHGLTPLHMAAQSGATEFVDLLIAHGADVNAKDNNDQTPLDLAGSQNHNSSSQPFGARLSVIPSGAAPLSYQWYFNGEETSTPGLTNAATILRHHGGVSETEMSTIRVVRKGYPNVQTIARRDPNGYNRCTLFEVIASVYAPFSWSAQLHGMFELKANEPPGLRFPDFSAVKIHRLKPGGGTNLVRLDLAGAFAAGDCPDMELKWGDVVEIPEADHKVEEAWPGIPKEARATLAKCLQRNVTILVKGQTTRVTLFSKLPFFEPSSIGTLPDNRVVGLFHFLPAAAGAVELQLHSFSLNDVVRGANVILSSSDLTRVKVKRANLVTKKTEEMVFDLGKIAPYTDLWLRDGDAIEIPEKGRD